MNCGTLGRAAAVGMCWVLDPVPPWFGLDFLPSIRGVSPPLRPVLDLYKRRCGRNLSLEGRGRYDERSQDRVAEAVTCRAAVRAIQRRRLVMNVSDSARGLRLLVLTTVFGAMGALLSMLGPGVRAQIPAVKLDVRAAKGLAVSPVYEGWYEVDGRRYALFSYSNRNLEEIVDVPIGPQNHLAPGPPDQGQPTHFYPGIFYGVFAAAMPKDQPTTELTWTLTANGQTLSIPVSLDPLYFISAQRENGTEYPGNTPPVLKFAPTGASAQGPHGIVVSRTATVARPLTLDVWVADDGLPRPRRESQEPVFRRVPSSREPRGLELTWQVYRGSGAVSFSDQTFEQGKARTTVTFSEPGNYMLQLLAIDSRSANRCCWTNGYVEVTVEGGAPRK